MMVLHSVHSHPPPAGSLIFVRTTPYRFTATAMMHCNNWHIVGFSSEDNKLLPGKPRRTFKLNYLIIQNPLNQIE